MIRKTIFHSMIYILGLCLCCQFFSLQTTNKVSADDKTKDAVTESDDSSSQFDPDRFREETEKTIADVVKHLNEEKVPYGSISKGVIGYRKEAYKKFDKDKEKIVKKMGDKAKDESTFNVFREELTKDADNGDPVSCSLAAQLLENGANLIDDEDEDSFKRSLKRTLNKIAFEYHLKAAEGGVPEDMTKLFLDYYTGQQGVEKDGKKANEWADCAMETGFPGIFGAMSLLMTDHLDADLMQEKYPFFLFVAAFSAAINDDEDSDLPGLEFRVKFKVDDVININPKEFNEILFEFFYPNSSQGKSKTQTNINENEENGSTFAKLSFLIAKEEAKMARNKDSEKMLQYAKKLIPFNSGWAMFWFSKSALLGNDEALDYIRYFEFAYYQILPQ